nr:hypothetical protein [Tanacetum cinerariifolium]
MVMVVDCGFSWKFVIVLAICQELTGWCIGRKDEGVKMYKEIGSQIGVMSSFILLKSSELLLGVDINVT